MKVRPKNNLTQFTCISLLCFILSQTLLACAPSIPASSLDTPEIVLQDCKLTAPGRAVSVDGKCAKLSVYEDPAAQSGRQIELNIGIFPAISRSPAPDALFLLAGGPGQSAVETFAPLLGTLIATHQKRDIVMIDQRGTGLSNPLNCPPDDGMAEEPSADQIAAYLSDCSSGLEADPRLYTTQTTVEDIEQVRVGLGYSQINLLGVSYGTRLALAYARAYPAQTRTLILDGVAPLDWSLGPNNPVNAQHALDLILERCAADTGCQAAFPNLNAELLALLEQLDQNPVQLSLIDPRSGVPTPLVFNRQKLAVTLQLMSYNSEYAALLPLLIHTAAADGKLDQLAAQYLILLGDLDQSVNSGLYFSVICAEDVPFYPDNPAPSNSFLEFDPQDMEQRCDHWPHAAISAEFHQPLRSEVPTLLLSGQADPVTPPTNAEQAAQSLSNSRHIVLQGMGHNVFYYGCLPRVIYDFLQTTDPAGLDITCTESIQPADFFTSFTGSLP